MSLETESPRGTWAVVWMSLLAAVASLVGFIAPMFDNKPPRGAWAAAIITGVAGIQIGNARRMFSYNAPDEIRPWMRPAASLLYAVSLGLFVYAIWTAIAR